MATEELKQPPVCLPVTLPSLIAVHVTYMHIIPIELQSVNMKFRYPMQYVKPQKRHLKLAVHEGHFHLQL